VYVCESSQPTDPLPTFRLSSFVADKTNDSTNARQVSVLIMAMMTTMAAGDDA